MPVAKCIFCGKEKDDFIGTYIIKNDGGVHYYCSSKCRKNHLKLGRDKRRLKWTTSFYESRDKRYIAEKKAEEKLKVGDSTPKTAKKQHNKK